MLGLDRLMVWTQQFFLPYGVVGLFAATFMESSFLPIPPDLLLILLSAINPQYAIIYAVVCIIGSLLGSAFGYWIGAKAGRPIIKKLVKPEKIDAAHKLYNKHGVFAVFIAAMTPLPYKLFTITSGMFHVNFKKFMFASLIGRTVRFMSIALLMVIFGREIAFFVTNYFEWFVLIFVTIAIAGFIAVKIMSDRIK